MRHATLVVLAAGALPALAASCRAPAANPAATAAAARAASGPAIPARRPASFPTDWRFEGGQDGATFGAHAMVASNSALASAAGVEIMKAGGNAVDAAVATGFALAVTLPQAGNLGGGGFSVIRMADGRTAAIDYREVAPLAASRDMYLKPGVAADASVTGPLASGVPGSVAGLTAAQARFGKLTLAQVMAPAIRLAEEGFVVDSAFMGSLRWDSTRFAPYAASVAAFYPGGQVPAYGSRFRQPDLARTLRRIAERGADGFYKGETAALFEAEMKRDGGLITRADLERYRPVWRDALSVPYRGYTLITMPPVSSGGTTIAETLNILETYDSLPPFGSTAYTHVLGSAYQRAFVDRNSKLGDPAFVRVPVAELTSKAYARQLRATIADGRYTPTRSLPAAGNEKTQTTHYAVVDADGNAVSTTTTLNNSFGSAVTVGGAGFLLNDEMDDFAAHPGKPNMFGLVEGAQNEIAPGKRMLSSMSPTIVLDPKGGLLLVVGAAGGPTIITATSQVILNVVDNRMSLADAMRAPRLHHQALPDSLIVERNGLRPAVRDSLAAMGYGFIERGAIANVNAVMRVPGGWEGMKEPRSVGGAVGY
ncbi:MAG TPA: gamma-glutamyltransferase [Gemmatimonadaceae bacterium]|nr:gamma-glutamyltransferase [Gemmatimonadaceae bacterium]